MSGSNPNPTPGPGERTSAIDDTAPATPPRVAGRSARPHGTANARRRRSREFALQGLYAWLAAGSPTGRSDIAAIDAHIRDQEDFDKADREHYDALLHGCIAEAPALDAVIGRFTDRRIAQLSPVEHVALWIGCYELQHVLEIPYRVVINEAVELAKAFGGTDGHKFVNGVLDKAGGLIRPQEARAPARPPRGPAPTPGAPAPSRGPDRTDDA
jgi:transcription antitermination protein NusB